MERPVQQLANHDFLPRQGQLVISQTQLKDPVAPRTVSHSEPRAALGGTARGSASSRTEGADADWLANGR